MQLEMNVQLCSKSAQPVSQFCQLSLDQMETFSWESCVSEFKQKSPTLFHLLSYIVSHTDHRNASKRGEKHYPGICMATATCILLKEHNRETTGIQAFFSLVLFSSRVQKKVCMYMYKVYLYVCDFQQFILLAFLSTLYYKQVHTVCMCMGLT